MVFILLSFQGPMGKREPGWNNLKGLWGKRSVMDYLDGNFVFN